MTESRGFTLKKPLAKKPASYYEPRISELTTVSNQPITSKILEISFQVSNRHSSVHSEYDALIGTTNHLLSTPSIHKFDGKNLNYWTFFNRIGCHVVDW